MDYALEPIAGICIDSAMSVLPWNLIAGNGVCIPGSRLMRSIRNQVCDRNRAAGLRGAVPLAISDALRFVRSTRRFSLPFRGENGRTVTNE